ncbi:MAG: GGDEF domain-containing protein [Fervidobacterium sp.]
MKDKIYLTELALIIDTKGYVKKILYQRDEKLNQLSQSNHLSIYEIIDKESVNSFKKILKELATSSIITDKLIGIVIEELYSMCLMNAIKFNNEILLIFYNDLSETIARELLKINNEQLNALRAVIKDLNIEKVVKSPSEEKLLNELIQLNNQLVNTQRELTKKNIELEILNKKLEELSITDPLTGVYNRRHFFDKIQEEIARAKRSKYKISLISIDLNNFKKINDNFGHSEGDRVLKEFAKRAQEILRKGVDSIYRFGGDEFVILLVNCDIENAEKVAQRLDEETKKINSLVSLSYGIEEIDFSKDTGKDLETVDIEKILNSSDKKMYEFKRKFKELAN